MPNELTEAHYAAMETLDAAVFTSKAVLVTEDALEEIARDLVNVVRGPLFSDAEERLRLARDLASTSAFTAAEAMDAVECVLNAYDKRRIQADALEEAATAICKSERLRNHTHDHMGDIEAAADELRRMAAALRSTEKGTTNA